MSSASDDFIAESSEISADPSATETDDDDDDEVPVLNIRQSKRARRPTKTQSFSSSYDPIAVSRPRRNVEKPVSYEDPGSSSFDERIGDSEDEEEVVEDEEAASSEEEVDEVDEVMEGVEGVEEEEEDDDDTMKMQDLTGLL